MKSIQCLILILATVLAADPVQAGVIGCTPSSSSLAESAQALLAVAQAGQKYTYNNAPREATSSSSSRAPATSYGDDGSTQGSTAGLPAVFNWFNKNATKSRGLCTLGVRMALQAGGLWPCGQGMGMSPQTDAGPNLVKNGYKKISLTDPSKAKPGTVLIYKGVCSSRIDKNAAYGHIEVRTNTGYSSDFTSSRPISTYNKCRQFKEAYVRVAPPGRSCNQTMGNRTIHRGRR